jgi:hypothetical protein
MFFITFGGPQAHEDLSMTDSGAFFRSLVKLGHTPEGGSDEDQH